MPPKAPPALGNAKGKLLKQTCLMQGAMRLSAVAASAAPKPVQAEWNSSKRVAVDVENASNIVLDLCDLESITASTTTGTGVSTCSKPTSSLEAKVERHAKKHYKTHVAMKYGVAAKVRLLTIASIGFTGVVLDLKVHPVAELVLESEKLKNEKRRTYTKDEKAAVVAAALSTDSRQAVVALRKRKGFEAVRSSQVTEWARPKVSRKMGRPKNEEFQAAVIDELVYCSIEKVDDVEKLVVQANVIYSYNIVVQAAQTVRSRAPFCDDPLTKSLKFSKPWVRDFLNRNGFNRRRVTNIEKVLPPAEAVDQRLKEIQKVLVEGKFERAQILNSDETGIFYGEKPKNQYVPGDAKRASCPESDDKARFTSMLFGSAAGKMGPTYNIVKCNSAKADLTGTRVLKNLVADGDGFKPEDGWNMFRWERTLALKNKKGTLESKVYKRPFLRHSNGTVITLQNKAWMDSVGIAMWIDVCLGPYVRDNLGKKAAMIWDNCGSHNSDAIAAVLRLWNITPLPLPPKMTDKLQIMDLVVNAPLKAGIRRDRVQSLFSYFQSWKIARLMDERLSPEEQKKPPFSPPKPTLRCIFNFALQFPAQLTTTVILYGTLLCTGLDCKAYSRL